MDTKSVERASHPVPVTDPGVDQKQVEERREIVKAIKAINATELFGENYELTFVLDRDTHRPLLRIIDRQTREVIRQLPPEYTLRLAEQIGLA
ncbi:MAG: flagellar protein FlaG [Acidobacteria bacterium]|nr:flagellar protein FlaG [Acidobacteriota bacterium]